VRVALAILAGVALAPAPASPQAAEKRTPAPKMRVAAKKRTVKGSPSRKRAAKVCFKKRGKRVCRPKRPAAKRVAAGPRPAAPTTSTVSAAPAAPSPAAAPAPSSPTPTPVAAPTPDCGVSPWVGYSARDIGNGDFRLVGSRTCVPGPNVIFQLRNLDEVEHHLYAEGV
jgi:hypothetical protein